MRGFVIFIGLLLLLGGGAVAGVQYAPIDLSTIDVVKQVFDKVPGSQEFLKTPMALYTGGGAAGLGFLMIIIAAATGGKKNVKDRPVVKPPAMAPEPPRRPKAKAAPKPATVAPPAANPAPPAAVAPPVTAAPKPPPMQPAAAPPVAPPPPAAPAAPRPAPAAAAPAPKPAPAPAPVAPPQPIAAAPTAPPPPKPAAPAPAPVAAPPPPRPAAPAPVAEAARKPQASAQPPAAAVGAPPPDPRVVNRKRVQDLVTINDALKAYQAKNGVFPSAAVLGGLNERGANWIPGLAPDFMKEVPRDPMHGATTQYVYVSDGANYKLLAVGVSLVGSPNVEVLGIKVDPTRNPTPESAAFGFWTAGFAGA